MIGHAPHPAWRSLWRILGPILFGAAKFGSHFDRKLEEAISGRRNETWKDIPQNGIVFHCASVGEFEAARPVMERMQELGFPVILTVGSPSLYRRRSNTGNTRFPWYWAPIDLHKDVKRFYDAAKPLAVVITKHDIWPEFVWQARDRKIPVILQSGNFRTDSRRNIAIARSFQRSLLGSLSGIGAIAKEDAARFRILIGHRTEIRITGDTRYDRVRAAAAKADARDPSLRKWCEVAPTIVLGSGWTPDETLLCSALETYREAKIPFRLIAVPHESDEEHILGAEQRLQNSGFNVVRYSNGLSQLNDADALLVDVQGVLSSIYRGAAIAWVGGGFGAGVHSVLEPAVFGVPLLYGPNITMSREARLFADCGGGIVVDRDASEWKEMLKQWLIDPESRKRAADASLKIIAEEAGATERVVQWIEALLKK